MFKTIYDLGYESKLRVITVIFYAYIRPSGIMIDCILQDENCGKVVKDRYYLVIFDACHFPNAVDMPWKTGEHLSLLSRSASSLTCVNRASTRQPDINRPGKE